MTIQTTFQFAQQRRIVRIIGNSVLFIDLQNNMMSPIEGLKLRKEGVEKEYPDLKGDSEWKQKAIQRFTDKIKSFESETQRMNWVIEELKQKGYKPLYIQRQGHRPQKVR